ncbi:MAG TPA: hypothetical protein VFI47_30565 [Acidimicrobiales bacterium]|nr:hypothetical protein [Acidimicrobiales bacterium]
MRTKLATCLIAAALALAACGSDSDDSTSAAGDTAEDTASDQGAAGEALVTPGDTDLGEVLTTADGMTVYGFTNDTDGTSSCEGGCAEAWPPIAVDGEQLPDGMDADVFSVIERPDGTFQLKAGDWPLYTFAGDEDPGDTNGQGSGGVWFAAKPDGSLLKDGASTDTTAADAGSGGGGY